MSRNKFTRILAGILCGVIVSVNIAPDFSVYASVFPEDGMETNVLEEESKEEAEEGDSAYLEETDMVVEEESTSLKNLEEQEEKGEGEILDVIAEDDLVYLEAEVSANSQGVELDADGNIASGTQGNVSWVIDKNGKLTIHGTGNMGNHATNGSAVCVFSPYTEYIKTAEVSVSGMTDASGLFYGCSNLTEIVWKDFDTSQITTMCRMFERCTSLTSLDLSGFDTRKVENMDGMFSQCTNLTELDLTSFNTSQVIDMGAMFNFCQKLESLDLRNFDTSNVTDMGGMFSFSGLKQLNLMNFDTSCVTDMWGMFRGCEDLIELDLGNFDTSQVTNMGYMFSGCENITKLNISSFDTSKVERMDVMFSECSSVSELKVNNFETNNVTTMAGMFGGCLNLKKLDISNFSTYKVTNMSGMFSGCSSLGTVYGLEKLDTSQVTDMRSMFGGCRSLEDLDLSNFNTSNVTDMSYMFVYCNNLRNLDLGKFDTAQVTDMSFMFSGCFKLVSLDLSSFNVEQTIDMGGMLEYCNALMELRTPFNINLEVVLPLNTGDTWYLQNGSTTTIMPMNRKTSVYLKKNEIPQIAYDKLRDWSGTITIPAGESKHLEYTVERSGDYLYPGNGDIVMSWQDPGQTSFAEEDIFVDEQNYKGFSVRMPVGEEKFSVRFTLENISEEDITLTLVTNTDFAVAKIQAGQSFTMSGNAYYSFTPDTYGCYEFVNGESSEDVKASVGTAWVYEQSTGRVLPDFGESSGETVLEAGKTYLLRVGGEQGTVFTVVEKRSKDISGNMATVQNGECYAFTPSETGYYGSVDSMERGRWYNSETRKWESWEGSSFPKKFEAGETYLFYVYGKEGSIQIAPRKQVTVLDYQYYQDFKADGGSVNVSEDGKVTLQKGKAKWTLKSYTLPLFVTGGTSYGSLSSDVFAEANLYWGIDLGIFKAAGYYDLDLTSRMDSEIQDGDVILVEYRPEIVWVQSMKLKCSKAAIEPGDMARMTAELSRGQEKYDFTADPVIRWESSNPGIAEVDADTGEVTAHAAGNVTITAYADEALREQEGLNSVVKASLSLKIAEIKKTFSNISNWKNSVKVEAAQSRYFSFRTANAGDYLVELPQGVKIKTYNKVNMEFQEVCVGDKTYACGSFPGGQEGTWQFELWNTDVQKAVELKLVTPWDLAQSVKMGTSVSLPESGSLPVYAYFSFTPEASGAYMVDGTPSWIYKKDGTFGKASEMLLAAGEICCMKFTAGGDRSFTVKQNPEYQTLEKEGKEDTFFLVSGQKYVCVPEKDGNLTAFTSCFDKKDVQVRYVNGNDWVDWPVYREADGNYSLPVKAGKAYALVITNTEESQVQIALPGYQNPNGTLASTLKLTSLTDAQLAGQGSASRMSASYKTSGMTFTANGTLKYIQNCTEYLGADGAYKSGYFLAIRLNVQKAKFRDGGYVSVSYLDQEGNRQKQFYEYNDADSTLKEGYVDLILDVSSGLRESEIRVASDAFTNIKTYQLKLENLKLEEGSSAGTFTEAGEKESYGVKTSSPIIKENGSGVMEALYDSVSYSTKIDLGDGEIRRGNYIALKAGIPDSMRNTKAGCSYRIVNTAGNSVPEDAVVYAGIPEGASYALFLLDAKRTSEIFGKTLEITWGVLDEEGNPVAGTDSLTQSVFITKTKNCYFETLPAGAALPKSIAFNGLSTTMYAGQSQNIAAVINRKYEEDLIRLSYSTSDSSVLSVNRVTGVIRALKAGTASVTVEAVDMDGNTVSKSAKITVKNPTAPSSVKISDIRDTSVTVSWGKNVTGQKFEVYAVPYDEVYDGKTRKTAAQWKAYIEEKLTLDSGMETPEWAKVRASVDSAVQKTQISGLEADTSYLFYVRNAAETAAGVWVYVGSLSGKTATKKTVFASIKLTAQIQTTDASGKNPVITDLPDSENSFTVGKDGKLGMENLPNRISYRLLDAEGEEIPSPVFTSPAYKSSNANVVKVDKNGNLTLGGQAGTAKIYVTGKDAAGVLRTSEEHAITIRVIREPASLKAKTTTLVIGESISLKELITYNGVKGAMSEIQTDGIDFEAVLEQIPEEYFVWDKTEPVSGDTRITAAALIPNKKGVPASGGTVKAADFVFTKTDKEGNKNTSMAAASIRINDMPAPVIKSTTPADTSISFTFAFNTTVKELTGEQYYYTVTVKDMVTGGEAELRSRGGKTEVVRKTGTVNAGMGLAFTQAPDMTVKSPVHTCVISGLSGNKKYQIRVTAHYDTVCADGRKLENRKESGTKTVTTKNRLLASENGIEITYISLTELKKRPDAGGSQIFKEEERDTDSYGHITLENNETYVFMAQVSNLARALETDKLKWTISSGDKKAATLKAGTSTFEAKLQATRTGTFTVTAASTVTKEELAVFTVTILPYQSSGEEGETQAASAGAKVAYLGGILSDPFREEKRKAA